MDSRGRLIALEGIDGCGKSTQAAHLATSLGALLTREPGGTALGASIRAALLSPSAAVLSPRAEVLLVAADRAQHVDEVISPALESGRWVVTDRYSPSTLAYQGFGHGLDGAVLSKIVGWAAAGLEPDVVVLVDLPVDVAVTRRGRTAPDRLEQLDLSFHQRVRDGYLAMAAADPDHWSVVDGTSDEQAVAQEIADLVRGRLGSP